MFFTAYIIVVVVITYQIQKNSIDTPNIFDQLRYVEHNVRLFFTTKNSGSFEVPDWLVEHIVQYAKL